MRGKSVPSPCHSVKHRFCCCFSFSANVSNPFGRLDETSTRSHPVMHRHKGHQPWQRLCQRHSCWKTFEGLKGNKKTERVLTWWLLSEWNWKCADDNWTTTSALQRNTSTQSTRFIPFVVSHEPGPLRICVKSTADIFPPKKVIQTFTPNLVKY